MLILNNGKGTAIACLLVAIGTISLSANATPTRKENAVRAEREFSQLHFFSDGMGMHASPNLTSAAPSTPVKNVVGN